MEVEVILEIPGDPRGVREGALDPPEADPAGVLKDRNVADTLVEVPLLLLDRVDPADLVVRSGLAEGRTLRPKVVGPLELLDEAALVYVEPLLVLEVEPVDLAVRAHLLLDDEALRAREDVVREVEVLQLVVEVRDAPDELRAGLERLLVPDIVVREIEDCEGLVGLEPLREQERAARVDLVPPEVELVERGRLVEEGLEGLEGGRAADAVARDVENLEGVARARKPAREVGEPLVEQAALFEAELREVPVDGGVEEGLELSGAVRAELVVREDDPAHLLRDGGDELLEDLRLPEVVVAELDHLQVLHLLVSEELADDPGVVRAESVVVEDEPPVLVLAQVELLREESAIDEFLVHGRVDVVLDLVDLVPVEDLRAVLVLEVEALLLNNVFFQMMSLLFLRCSSWCSRFSRSSSVWLGAFLCVEA